jgi:hypothetical protein
MVIYAIRRLFLRRLRSLYRNKGILTMSNTDGFSKWRIVYNEVIDF